MAANTGHGHRVVYGDTRGGRCRRGEERLAEQYPGTTAPDINFVLAGDVNVPNGGFVPRFAGLYIPILDWTFDGFAPTDTQFETIVINHQYDGFADFPLYPLNVVSST